MTKKEILKRIYPSVVTFASDWQSMVKEVKRFGLKKISLFLTCTNLSERKKIYLALEKTGVKEIPHVHLRQDMGEGELDYLVKRFKARAFTIHFQYFKNFSQSKYLDQIYIESNRGPGLIKNLRPFKRVGVCVDLSHIYAFKKLAPKAVLMADLALGQSRLGCNHISAVYPDGRGWHEVRNFSDLDYLKKLPKKYFSRYLCLEVINPIKEQLEFKKYIAELLFKAWKD